MAVSCLYKMKSRLTIVLTAFREYCKRCVGRRHDYGRAGNTERYFKRGAQTVWGLASFLPLSVLYSNFEQQPTVLYFYVNVRSYFGGREGL